MKNILTTIDTLYFQPKRDKNNLLLRRTQNELSSPQIESLSKNIEALYDFYTTNSTFLGTEPSSKDALIRKEFSDIKTLYNEYFSALRDYDNYSIQYDGAKRSLIDLESITQPTENLSISVFQTYFSRFVGVDLSHGEVLISSGFYDVKNIVIEGQTYSFQLNPTNNNEISQIKINNEQKSSSYKLDIIEYQWKQLYNGNITDTTGSTTRYDFSRFFSLTFFGNKTLITNPVILDNGTPIPDESKVVRVFKQKILSPEVGIFRTIPSLKINYNAVTVTQENDTYSIKLSGIPFAQDIQLGEIKENLNAIFSSDLVYGETNIFKNIKIQVKSTNGVEEQSLIFGGTPITLIGSIPLPDFNDRAKNIGKALARLKHISGNMSIPIETPSIFYFVSTDKTNIKFFSNGGTVLIQLNGDIVESLTFAGKNKINRTINYTEINQYLR